MKSHAARSASTFDRRYALRSGSPTSVQTVSSFSVSPLCRPRLADANEKVLAKLLEGVFARLIDGE